MNPPVLVDAGRVVAAHKNGRTCADAFLKTANLAGFLRWHEVMQAPDHEMQSWLRGFNVRAHQIIDAELAKRS